MTPDEFSVTKKDSVDKKIEEATDNNGHKYLCSSRFALTVVAFFGIVNAYALRANMSVAIVCMTTTLNDKSEKNCSKTMTPIDEHNVNESQYLCENETMSKQNDMFDWDKETQGLILGSFFLGYVLAQIPAGWFAGKYGGKQLYGWSMFVSAVATFLTPLAARTSVVLLIVIRAFIGLCQGVMIPCVHALLCYWIPPLERSTSVGIVYAGTKVGVMVAFPLSGVLCVDGFDGGWPSIFYVSGCHCVVWFLAWMYFVYDTPLTHPRISENEREYIVHTLQSELNVSQKSSGTPWSKMFSSLPVWAIIISQTCAEWGGYTFLTNIPSYMDDVLKFDIRKAGFLASLPYLGFWVVTNISACFADFLRKRGYISTTAARKIFNTIGNIIPAILIVIMGNVTDDPGIAVGMLTLGIAMTGFRIASGSIVNAVDIAPRYAGIILGICNITSSLGGFFSPLAIGIITVDKTREQWKTVFYITGAVLTFGAIIFAIFASGEIQPWAREKEDERSTDITEERVKSEGDTITDRRYVECNSQNVQTFANITEEGDGVYKF